MELQLELFTNLAPQRGETIEERFLEFHALNPHVYRNLVSLARRLKASGQRRTSMKFLIERLRWEYIEKTNRSGDEYAINNDYTSRYARLLMDTCPDLNGFFETRALREAAEA